MTTAASPTMKQIAQRARVSVMTVSRALHDTSVSPKTRARVLRAATALGYRLNTAAQSISSGRFNAVALLVDASLNRDHLPAQLLHGVQAALDERQRRLILAHLNNEQLTSEEHVPTILSQLAADGLLINYKHHVPPRLTELINQHHVPVIWIDSDRPTDSVMADHADGARASVQYLLSLGHRRIAFADHHMPGAKSRQDWNYHYSLAERRAGYVDAMREAGLTPRLFHHSKAAQDDTLDRVSIARQWLEAPDRPTAIVCYVMATATPLYIAATSLGLRVPKDLSILTASSENESHGLHMNCMRVPEFEMGRVAVEMLSQRIEQSAAPIPSRSLPMTFCRGRTCGPPQGDNT